MDQTLMVARASGIAVRTEIVVIGGGQAGLSAAYHLKLGGLVPDRQFLVLDEAAAAGGAWQHRWPSLTLSTVNRIHDLPGMPFRRGPRSRRDRRAGERRGAGLFRRL